MGRYQVALDAAARAVELEPRQVFGQMNLLTALVALNRFDEAKGVAGRMLERDPNNRSAHIARYAIADFLGDTAARDRELAWSRATADGSGVHLRGGGVGRTAWAVRRVQRGCFRTSFGTESGLAQRRRGREHAQRDGVATTRSPAWTARPEQAVDASVALARTDTSVGVAAHRRRPSPAARTTRKRSWSVRSRIRPLSTLNIGVFAPTARMALALDGPLRPTR